MLPCYVGSFFGARTKAHGYLSVDQTGWSLILHDGVIEDTLLDESTDRVHLPWSELREVSIKRGRFQDTITFQLAHAGFLGELPGAEKDRLVLQVQTKHRSGLNEIERRAHACQAEGKPGNSDIDPAIDDIQDFLNRI